MSKAPSASPAPKQSEQALLASDHSLKIEFAEGNTLKKCIDDHLLKESVSFHTPGHKGRLKWSVSSDVFRYDLTELPRLDDLSHPEAVLAQLERQVAQTWGAHESVISVNGASNGLLAALLTVAHRGDQILIPRNSHRSVVNGLALAGLNPVWYEPTWRDDWGVWGQVDANALAGSIEAALSNKTGKRLAGVMVVSPSYPGDVSDIRSIASVCHEHSLPLIVDEAHGAHLLTAKTSGLSALANDADLVVHSFHKNLDALTQCGAVHIGEHGAKEFGFSAGEVRAATAMTHTSSPSYILLRSIEEMTLNLQSGESIDLLSDVHSIGKNLKRALAALPGVSIYESKFATSPLHVLVSISGMSGQNLSDALASRGIFVEGIFGGNDVLLMLGIGTIEADIASTLDVFRELTNQLESETSEIPVAPRFRKPALLMQAMSPRDALLSPKRLIPTMHAEGRIAAECVSTCPPGWPIIVPGQRIDEHAVASTSAEFLRVVDSD